MSEIMSGGKNVSSFCLIGLATENVLGNNNSITNMKQFMKLLDNAIGEIERNKPRDLAGEEYVEQLDQTLTSKPPLVTYNLSVCPSNITRNPAERCQNPLEIDEEYLDLAESYKIKARPTRKENGKYKHQDPRYMDYKLPHEVKIFRNVLERTVLNGTNPSLTVYKIIAFYEKNKLPVNDRREYAGECLESIISDGLKWNRNENYTERTKYLVELVLHLQRHFPYVSHALLKLPINVAEMHVPDGIRDEEQSSCTNGSCHKGGYVNRQIKISCRPYNPDIKGKNWTSSCTI